MGLGIHLLNEEVGAGNWSKLSDCFRCIVQTQFGHFHEFILIESTGIEAQEGKLGIQLIPNRGAHTDSAVRRNRRHENSLSTG